jgi:hypothetical protein
MRKTGVNRYDVLSLHFGKLASRLKGDIVAGAEKNQERQKQRGGKNMAHGEGT